jgi:hypothetical protein
MLIFGKTIARNSDGNLPLGYGFYYFTSIFIFSNFFFCSVDFATLAFASVGMPYDLVKVNATVDISSYLSTSTDTGSYSGIVSVYTNGKDPLSAAQNALISAYQTKYNVKWVIVGATSITGLSGVTPGTIVDTEYFDVTFASGMCKTIKEKKKKKNF